MTRSAVGLGPLCSRAVLAGQDQEWYRTRPPRVAGAHPDAFSASNLRLVVAIAKRHAAQTDNFFELLSGGNMSLIRAVEKFDYSRGNKFSTYASWAIMKNFARSIPEEKRRRERYVTGHEDMFEAAPDTRSDEQEMVSSVEQTKHRVNRLLEYLEPRDLADLGGVHAIDSRGPVGFALHGEDRLEAG